MAQATALLEEEDEVDENVLLLNFYQANHSFLRRVPLHRIPDKLKLEAAALYYGSSLHEFEWRGILEDLGMDHITMLVLDFKSSKTGDLPIYLALNGVLKNNKSFGDFVDVLCRERKFHILLRLKPFVEELLAEKQFLNEEDTYFEPPPGPSAPSLSGLSLTESHVSDRNYSTQHDTGCYSANCPEIRVQQANGYKTTLEHFQNSEVKAFVNKKRLSSKSNFQVDHSVDELISVFIMHSMVDKKYARKLAACLSEENLRVITSANIYYYLRENPTMLMKLVDKKMDFIVPIISASFLEQIKIRWCNDTEEKDIESAANTFMYDCLLNEYSNSFRNRRVRPVCYKLESKKLKISDQILSWPYYLPYGYLRKDQFQEFLKLLRLSKKRLNS